MTAQEGIALVEVPAEKRIGLEWILEESFEGWYLLHSRRTLRDVDLVKAAMLAGNPIGLVMLKTMEGGSVGYVYYIALAKSHRKKGIGKMLLEDALQSFKKFGVKEVFASVEKDNEPSERLFASEGFTRTSFGEVSKRHGKLHAVEMYNAMRVVPGEVLLRKEIM